MKKLIPVLLFAFCLTGAAMAQDMIKAAGSVFINSAGEKKEAVLSGKIIGFYFAHQLCKSFTTNLVDFYSGTKKEGRDFEIIFVGAGSSASEMMQCMQDTKMPWLAVPYDSAATAALKQIKRAGLNGARVPALIIVRDGQIITERGQTDVQDTSLAAYQKWLTMEPETNTPAKTSNKKTNAAIPKEKGMTEQIEMTRRIVSDGKVVKETTVTTKKPVANKESRSAIPGSLPPPEEEKMTMDELRSARIDLDGKVIKTTITHVRTFKQVNEEQYSAYCGYYKGKGASQTTSALIPKEGKEFFQKLEKVDLGGSDKIVYFLVHSKRPIRVVVGTTSSSYPLEAVGIHYSSEGGYSW